VRGIAEGLDRVFRQLMVLFALLALMLAAVFSYLIGSIRPDLDRYRESDRSLDLAHAAMIDQETGLRGYLLMQDPSFLEPYRAGVKAAAAENQNLARLLGTDSTLAPLLLTMRVSQQAWQSEWAATVANGGLPTGAGALRTFNDRGKNLFDDYRASEAALRDEVWERRNALYAREGWVLGGGFGATVALGCLLLAAVLRNRRRLKESVVPPVVAIESATEAIARHDLTAHLVPTGPTEFRRIAEAINTMRDALAEARDQERADQERIAIQAGQLRNILAMSREISGSLNLRYVLRTVASSAATVSGFSRVIVWLSDDETSKTLSAAYDSRTLDGAPVEDLRVELGVGVVGQAVRYGRTATENEARQSSVEVHPEHSLRSVAVPLVVGARVSGAIELSSDEPHRMTEGTLEVLETLASHAASAIEAAGLHTSTEALAHTDALTGLANRRRLDADLALECERSARYHRPLALLMFDVDHFKRLNDTLGHARGDEVLQQLAEVVVGEIRTTDTAYRYGGEEFVVLARETGDDDALGLAERLRSRIERHFAARGSAESITASFGVGLIPPEDPSPAHLVARADEALYRAKGEGRNKLCGPAYAADATGGVAS
jgi:diguanylate cyclase (GGDEF)-like protein